MFGVAVITSLVIAYFSDKESTIVSRYQANVLLGALTGLMAICIEADLFSEFPACSIQRFLIIPLLSFGYGPCSFLPAFPERSARMGEKYLYPVLSESVHDQSCALLGHGLPALNKGSPVERFTGKGPLMGRNIFCYV
jgi:hypothetical protein